jgi:putative transposase
MPFVRTQQFTGKVKQVVAIEPLRHIIAGTVITRELPDAPVEGEISLSPEDAKTALARFDLLREYRHHLHRKANTGNSVLELKNEFVLHYNAGIYPPLLDRLGSITNYKTLDRWLLTLRASGNNYTSLAPGYSAVKDTMLTEAEQQEMIRAICNPNKLNNAQAYRYVQKTMERRGTPVTASQDTFVRFAKRWINENYDVYIFLREGDKAYEDKVSPFLVRDFDSIEVGEVIVGDGHTLNFECINPFTGNPKRMNMILFYDFKSGMPLGFEIMTSEDTKGIASALRRSIMMLGFIPKYVFLDNGRAFTSKYFNGTDLETCGLDGLFNRLGITAKFMKAYRGRSKPIEQFFRTFADFERLQTAFSGVSIEDKPARMKRNETFHKAQFKKSEKPYLTLSQVYSEILSWYEDYANRRHVGGFYKGMTPAEVYNRSLEKVMAAEDFGQRLIDKDALSLLMMESKLKKIRQNGIRFNKTDYYNPDLHGYRNEVLIRYDIADLSRIYVFTLDGMYLGHADSSDRVAVVAETAAEKEKLSQRLTLIQGKKKETIQKARQILGVPKEMIIPEIPVLSDEPLAEKLALQQHIEEEKEEARAQAQPDFSFYNDDDADETTDEHVYMYETEIA